MPVFSTAQLIVSCYLAALSLLTFFLFGIDKYRAVRGLWRIRERTLLLLCFFGGAFGGLLGMLLFRHKIRNKKFLICVPLSLFCFLLLGIYIFL